MVPFHLLMVSGKQKFPGSAIIKGVKNVRSAIKLLFFLFSNFVLNDINNNDSN